MADLHDEPPEGLSGPLDKIGRVISSLLVVADLVLRLFGKRKTDRPQRDPGAAGR